MLFYHCLPLKQADEWLEELTNGHLWPTGWNVGEFENCNTTCGSGTQWRRVWCAAASGRLTGDELCQSSSKPPATQACSSFADCSYSFNAGEWGSCSTMCGVGTKERTVECLRFPSNAPANSPASLIVEQSLCAAAANATPASTEPCSDYSDCTYSWSAGPWQPCSTNCGSNGTRTRTVSCRRSDGTAADASICTSSFGDSAKPAESEPCSDTSGCPYAYVDECATGTHTCSSSAVCTDTFGSFTCACNEGYQGNGKVCRDINECVYSSSCPFESSTCINTQGSFLCECKKGFYLDGSSCTACPANLTTPTSGSVGDGSCSICAAGYYGEPSSAAGCSPCPFASTSSDGTLSESGCRCVPGYTLNTTTSSGVGGSASISCVLDADDSRQHLLYVSLPQLSCSTFCGSLGKSCKGGLLQNEYTEEEIAAASRNTRLAVEGPNRFFKAVSYDSYYPTSWYSSRYVCTSQGAELAIIRNAQEDRILQDECLGQRCTIGLTHEWSRGYFWVNGSGLFDPGSSSWYWTGYGGNASYIPWQRTCCNDRTFIAYNGIWSPHSDGRQVPFCERRLDESTFPTDCSKAGSAGMRTSYEAFAPYVSASSTCYSQVSRIPGSDTCDETPTLAGAHRLCACAAPCLANYYGTGNNCTRCPAASVSAAGSTSISQCSCLAGYYMAEADNTCRRCPALSSTFAGSVGIAECKCIAGTYMDSSGTCQSCPANTNSTWGSIGADSCSCSAGYYGDPMVGCEACPHISTSKEGTTDITGCFCPKFFGVARLGYSRQIALDTDVCDVELSSTPANTSGWHLTGEGESCEASCSARSLSCQELQGWEIYSDAHMTSLVATNSFDIACPNIMGISGYYGAPPLSIQASTGICWGRNEIPHYYDSMANSQSFCTRSSSDFRRMCYCTCPANHYGTSTDDCQACPPNMVSPAGSRLASDCVCAVGYHRVDDSSPCQPCTSNVTEQYYGVKDTFSSNQDVRGWEGANGTSECGEYGHLLGGAGVLGDSSSLRKTYTDLCTHNKVVIRFSVVLMDGWENETVALFVGGVPVSSHMLFNGCSSLPWLICSAQLRILLVCSN